MIFARKRALLMKAQFSSRLRKFVRLSSVALVLVAGGLSSLHAQTVNFDTLPVGPNNFAAAGVAQVINVPGVITVSGGVVLGNPTFLPAFTAHGSSPNLYGTADFADPSLLDTITLDLPSAENVTSLTGVLFNGQGANEDYTLVSFSGATTLQTLNLNLLPTLSANAFSAFAFNSTLANPITKITVTTPNAAINGWDFFIDTLVLTSSPNGGNPVPEPSATLLLSTAGVVFGSIFGARRRRLKTS